MNKQLFVSTALGLILGTAAFAQSPSSTTANPPSSAQTQTNSSGTSSSMPSSAQSQPSDSTKSTTTTSQSAPASSSTPSQAQTSPSGTAPSSGSSQAQTSPSSTAPSSSSSQVQTTTPSGSMQPGGSSTPSQAQTNNPPPANNQAQQTPNSSTGKTAQQPNQPNTAQSAGNSDRSMNINEQQKTRVTQSIARLNVQPLNSVNFSVSVGTVIPLDVRLQTLPADVVEVVPQYRGYDFFVVRDEIVIVEPSTHRIVTVLPHSGSATAVRSPSQNRVSFSEKDREVVRKHVHSAPSPRRTTGSTSSSTRVEIRRGERLPDSVEIEEFPETVYREAPSLREYRYLERDNRTYLIEPRERRVIEEIE
jgi:Protein of unknown function (DUF1236)